MSEAPTPDGLLSLHNVQVQFGGGRVRADQPAELIAEQHCPPLLDVRLFAP